MRYKPIREGVIMYTFMIFIGTGDIQNFIAMLVGIEIGIGKKKARTFKNYFCAAIAPDGNITCRCEVFPESIDDIRANMDLLVAKIRTHGSIREHISHIK